MRSAMITMSAALVAGAAANTNGTIIYTTDVVTAYTTYCPAATAITHGTQTYIVTEVNKCDAPRCISNLALTELSRPPP